MIRIRFGKGSGGLLGLETPNMFDLEKKALLDIAISVGLEALAAQKIDIGAFGRTSRGNMIQW